MSWNWRILRNGEFWLDAGCMLGIIPRGIWSKWITTDEANRMRLSQNGLLLESGGKYVVIEVGIGDKFGDKERTIYKQQDRHAYQSVAEFGVDPKDVSSVILTHLHFDHAGGLTRRAGSGNLDEVALTFPNAEIIVQRREWEDAIANKSTMTKTYLRNHLNPAVAERARLIDGESEVLPGITVWPVPGHTWGQQAVRFADRAERTIVFVPDVIPTRHHATPTACMAYDVESYTSQQERMKLLDRAEEEKWDLVINHEADHPVFQVGHHPDKPTVRVLQEVGLDWAECGTSTLR